MYGLEREIYNYILSKAGVGGCVMQGDLTGYIATTHINDKSPSSRDISQAIENLVQQGYLHYGNLGGICVSK